MRDLAEHAPLELCISKLGEEVSALPLILQSITRQFKGKHAQCVYLLCCILFSVYATFIGVHTLDLSNTMVDDTDISHLMSQCSNIRVLKLAGCRKLTSVSVAMFKSNSGKLTTTRCGHKMLRPFILHV